MKTRLVKQYMTPKKELIEFSADTDIFKAIETLINRAISGAPVTNKQGELIGVLSEKDCLKVLLQIGMHELPPGKVGEYMTQEVETVDQNQSIFDVIEKFQSCSFRRFPVVDGNKLVGLMTRRDVLKVVKDFK